METIVRSGNKELVEAAAQQAPSTELEFIRRALLDAQKHNVDLESDVTALKEQLTRKESAWEEEKERILKALRNERVVRKQARSDLKQQKDSQPTTKLASDVAAQTEQTATKESAWEEEKERMLKALRNERVIRKQAQADLKKKETDLQELVLQREKELQSVEHFWMKEIEQVTAAWKEENRKLKEISEKDQLSVINQMNHAHASEMRVSMIIRIKDDLVARLTEAETALQNQTLESETRLQEKELQLIQSKAESETKLAAREDELRSELASKEETMQELLRNHRETVLELNTRLSLMEDRIQLQTTINSELQARLLSHQEENMTSEELKVKKKELKRRIKEKTEQEKKQKEQLKRLKKEKEAKEKKEKKDLKRERKEKGK